MQDSVLFFMVFAFGLGVGGSMGWCLTWLYGKSQRAELEAKRDAETEKIEWIKNAQQNLREAFEALASKSLRENGREVLTRINQNLNTHAQHIDGLKGALEKNINQNLNTHAQHIDGLKGALEKNINQNLNTHAQHIGVLKGSLEKNLNVNLTSHTQHIDVLKAALEKNVNQNLMSHAQHIGLLKATLEKNISQLDGEIRVMEQKREGAYQSLKQQIIQLERAHSFLHQTTQQPLAALKSGPVRGRWGEIQLRKIVEMSGMSEHVSFNDQIVGEIGGKPDTVVHLPNEGHIPVDSKFPLQAFLEGIEAIDEEIRVAKFREHVKVMKEKIRDLSKKGYWREFDPSPELVIMFIPIESCLMVAYEFDPGIIEYALEHKVILASPVTLLGFLKSIAYGWQQFTINKNARKILAQGKELYSRIETWMEHFRKTGERLSAASKSYNDSVASLQS